MENMKGEGLLKERIKFLTFGGTFLSLFQAIQEIKRGGGR